MNADRVSREWKIFNELAGYLSKKQEAGLSELS